MNISIYIYIYLFIYIYMVTPPPHMIHTYGFPVFVFVGFSAFFPRKNVVNTVLEYKKLYYIIPYKSTGVFMCILLLKRVSCGSIKF